MKALSSGYHFAPLYDYRNFYFRKSLSSSRTLISGNSSGKQLRAILTPESICLHSKKQICWAILQGTVLCIKKDFNGLSESSLGAQLFCWFCHVAAHMMIQTLRQYAILRLNEVFHFGVSIVVKIFWKLETEILLSMIIHPMKIRRN